MSGLSDRWLWRFAGYSWLQTQENVGLGHRKVNWGSRSIGCHCSCTGPEIIDYQKLGYGGLGGHGGLREQGELEGYAGYVGHVGHVEHTRHVRHFGHVGHWSCKYKP